MERLVANLSGKTRRETISGREFLVAPVTMIVPGVLNGSQGPLLYSKEEVSRNVDAWNGVPLLANHPSSGSGRNPSVINVQGIGTVFGSFFGDKLQAEAWFDIENTRRIDHRILSALEANRKIELSTGLSLDTTPAEANATFNGQAYSFSVSNLHPDHLAVLIDSEGACSVGDGCGVLVNKKNKGGSKMLTEEKKAAVDSIIANSCCHDEEDREVLNEASDEKLSSMTKAIEKQKSQAVITNAAIKDFTDAEGNTHVWNATTKAWDMTKNAFPFKGKGGGKGKDEDEEEDDETKNKDKKMTKNTKPLTDEEWLASAPPSVRENLQFANNEKAKQKEAIVARLVANVKDEQEQARLHTNFMTMNLSALQDLALTLPSEKAPVLNYAGAASPATPIIKNAEKDFASFGLPAEYIENEKE